MDEADFINVIVETNAKCYFKSERERRREIKIQNEVEIEIEIEMKANLF